MYVDWSFCCCCCFCWLLLLICGCASKCPKLTTTTKLHINNNKKKINLHTFPFQFSITHINSFPCIAMYDCTSPIVEQQMTTIWTHYTLQLSTSLHHQMPVWGGHLTKCQSDPKDDQMSSWPDVVLLLVTRCLYQGVHLTKCQSDPKDDQMSRWPDIVPFLATRCLYGGMSELRCTRYIWKFEHKW